MKAIHITVDEALLARLDSDPEVQALGRSAAFRSAAEMYLRHRRKIDIRNAYRRAYGKTAGPDELQAWDTERVWPEAWRAGSRHGLR